MWYSKLCGFTKMCGQKDDYYKTIIVVYQQYKLFGLSIGIFEDCTLEVGLKYCKLTKDRQLSCKIYKKKSYEQYLTTLKEMFLFDNMKDFANNNNK